MNKLTEEEIMKTRPHFDYPIDELLQQRWSPRAFSDKMLTTEQVLTLFEAARWAASCNNEQPWRFIWSLKDGSEKYNKLFECLAPGNQEWVKTAPLLIMTLAVTHFPNGKPNKWAPHDLGLAMGNLTTQASVMGLYVHNMAGFFPDKAREIFALPESLEPMTMAVAGYIGDPSVLSEFNQGREAQIQERKPFTEILL
jgi:nitroreductase